MMRTMALTFIALALASCNAQPAPENATGQNEAAAAPVANGSAAVNEAPPAPEADATNEIEPAPAASIPAALQGRWALTPNDCTSTRGDAKGLLVIADKQLRFYESRAILGQVQTSEPNRIEADFAFTGEGQEWQRRMILEGQDGGKTLIRREFGPDSMPGPLRYSRCASV